MEQQSSSNNAGSRRTSTTKDLNTRSSWGRVSISAGPQTRFNKLVTKARAHWSKLTGHSNLVQDGGFLNRLKNWSQSKKENHVAPVESNNACGIADASGNEQHTSLTRQLAFGTAGPLQNEQHRPFFAEAGANYLAKIATACIFLVTALLLIIFWYKNSDLEDRIISRQTKLQNSQLLRVRTQAITTLLGQANISVTDFQLGDDDETSAAQAQQEEVGLLFDDVHGLIET